MKGLDFRCPDGQRTARGGCLLRHPSGGGGETTAPVGPSGFGKTTLVKLLWRLYDPSTDDRDIEAAARNVGAYGAISRLRHGYDTILGKWFDEGGKLSVGEWQKTAPARAFVRGAQPLVFDEPTSALGPAAADRIHAVDQGSICESGTHEELIGLGGRYSEMYEVQARAYEPQEAGSRERGCG